MAEGMLEDARLHAQIMDKIAALVGVRERTRKELSARLARQGFPEAAVREALDSAVRVGLVDERRYAQAYIRGKVHAGWGKGKIVMKLREAGVPEEVIDSCSAAFPGADDELAAALHELSRRPTYSSNPEAALMRRLVGKGYSFDLARRAVRMHLGCP